MFERLFFPVALLLSAPAFGAHTYYVSPSGYDTNSGSSASPFRQIRPAVALAGPGDTILVSDGSYLGFDVNSKTGAMNAPITIRATGTNANVTVTTDRSDNRDTIYITYSAWIVVDGLRGTNANRAAVRVDWSPHVTIRNGVFGDNAEWGIFTDFSDDLLIENNECYGSVAQHGIYVSNSGDRPTVRNNRCHDNTGAGIQLNADASQKPGDGIISGALLEQNVIFNNSLGGGGAMNLDGVQDSVVRNNLLFNNHASGIICFKQDGAQGPKGMQILNNTVDMAADGRWALGLTQTAGSNYVRNNILLARGATRGGLRFVSATDVNNTDSDYNILNYTTPDDGKTRYTLVQWQVLGHDLHSRTGALANLFINDAIGNYHLASNSVAVNTGQTLANVTSDLERGLRPFGLGFDCGCYEQRPLSLSVATWGGGQVLLLLSGGAAAAYQLEYSSDLKAWFPLISLVGSNRSMQYLDTNSPVIPSRLYRARAQ
jgi:parallel beta-helix repeat protein